MTTVEAVTTLETIDDILNDVASLERLTGKQRFQLQKRAQHELGKINDVLSLLTGQQHDSNER
jgi:hypothetical protein